MSRQARTEVFRIWLALSSGCLLLCCGACSPAVEHRWLNPPSAEGNSSLVDVDEVLGGDEISLKDGRKVKYLGIEAPREGEMREESRRANEWLLRHGKILLIEDGRRQDAEGRTLAYVFSATMGVYCFANQEMLEYGYATVSRGTSHKYQKEFEFAQEIAMRENRGIWKRR